MGSEPPRHVVKDQVARLVGYVVKGVPWLVAILRPAPSTAELLRAVSCRRGDEASRVGVGQVNGLAAGAIQPVASTGLAAHDATRLGAVGGETPGCSALAGGSLSSAFIGRSSCAGALGTRPARTCGLQGETLHVRLVCVLRPAAPVGRVEYAIGVDLAFEPVEECGPSRRCAR